MEKLMPVLQAVAHGTYDSCENVLINIGSALPWPGKDQRAFKGPCLDGKVCIVTGANAGIGYATAKKLAERGARVILACRSETRGKQAAKELQGIQPCGSCKQGSVEFQQLDLNSLKSVKQFCRQFNKSGSPLDILICNAGIMSPPERLVSEDGLELQFQVNFLSHWLLAHDILSEQRRRRLKSSKGKQQQQALPGSRLVLLSSLTHHAGTVQWDDKQSLEAYSPFTSYALSKMCNTIIAQEFQRRFDRNPAYGADSAVAIHPGIVNTNLATGFFTSTGERAVPWLHNMVAPVLKALFPLILRTPDSSAENMVAAATAPSGKVAGKYLSNGHLAKPNKFTTSEKIGEDLWSLATKLTGVMTDESLA